MVLGSLVGFQQGLGNECQVASRPGTCNVQLIACLRVDVPEAATVPCFHAAGVQDNAYILVSVDALRGPPVLGKAVVLVVLLVEQLDRSVILVDGSHRRRVILEANCAGPIVVRLDLDADPLRDEVTYALAAAAALLEAVGVDLQLGPLELVLVGAVVVMKAGIDVAVTARVECVLVEVSDEGHANAGRADGH